jgi:hypothetical protein
VAQDVKNGGPDAQQVFAETSKRVEDAGVFACGHVGVEACLADEC